MAEEYRQGHEDVIISMKIHIGDRCRRIMAVTYIIERERVRGNRIKSVVSFVLLLLYFCFR